MESQQRAGFSAKRLQALAVVGTVALALAALSETVGRAADRRDLSSPPSAAASSPRHARILSHDLTVELLPDRHELRAVDRLQLTLDSPQSGGLVFSLHASLRVRQIRELDRDGAHSLAFTAEPSRERQPEDAVLQRVTVRLAAPASDNRTRTLEWTYDGPIDDPPRDTRHLRFVTPSETRGHIGPEGVYLSGETHWYPSQPGSLPTFRVRTRVPAGWEAVTHGREVDRQARDQATETEWLVAAPTEALSLVANRFVVSSRIWQPPAGAPVLVATYLFPDDAPLAQEYLDASVEYLAAYSALLGPYPFPKFAVVENFFASGLGMPSFTLLGSGSIKRHYVQPYALGHEIVHSWVGNWVLNDVERGNWVEGLTTYLANYYYDELTGKLEEARAQRRLMLFNYAVYVRPERDYPVVRFAHKTDQADNAIGYQKTAMVFHQLRREIGDAPFWQGVRALIAQHGGAYATWADVEAAFSRVSRQPLREFFAQWVERAGAPAVTLADVSAAPAGEGQYRVTVRLKQETSNGEATPYRLSVPLEVVLESGQTAEPRVTLDRAEQTFTLAVPGVPIRLRLDPTFETFRRLDRSRLPPMLNLFVTDPVRSVLVPDGGSAVERAPYEEVAKQIRDREGIVPMPGNRPVSAEGSVLVLGGPGLNAGVDEARKTCGNQVSFEADRVTVKGQVYEGPGLAVLLSCRRPDRPGSVVSLFYGDVRSAAKVARLLFFYGWQGYILFRDGAVIARGDLEDYREEWEVRREGL